MSEESKTITTKFDEATLQQARERFGYVDAEKQYKIRDLCDVLLPDRTPDTASRLIRKEVRTIQEAAGIETSSGQYKFTADEATALSLQIEKIFSKNTKIDSVSAEETGLSQSKEESEQVIKNTETESETEQDIAELETESHAGPKEAEAASSEPVSEPMESKSNKQESSSSDEIAEVAIYSKRQIRGNVVSKSGHKSLVVLVERKVKHPLYKKYIKRSNKLHAHDEHNESRVGDIVSIESCRPISKKKCWRLVKVVAQAQ